MAGEPLLERAIAIAVESAATGGGPFGAVVGRADAVLAEGTNRVVATRDPTAHAEIVAIRAACAALGTFELSGSVLYSSTEPCPMCLAAAWWARVDEIVFAADRHAAAHAGFDDADIYREVAVELGERRLSIRQALPEAGDAPFRAWAENPDRVPY